MFLKFKQEKIVNLDNVSNIFIEESHNGRGKVIFNMNYSVKIFGDKITPDYVYWNYDNIEDLAKITSSIEQDTVGWVKPAEEGQRYVNTKCISSINTDPGKNRVIFNLNYQVTHPRDTSKLTSDFVFFNFSSTENYNTFLDNFEKNL
jgi:hypothetical protein